MVEVEGIAPSSCPSFDLYQRIMILFIPDYSSIVKLIIQNLLQHLIVIFLYLQDVLQ